MMMSYAGLCGLLLVATARAGTPYEASGANLRRNDYYLRTVGHSTANQLDKHSAGTTAVLRQWQLAAEVSRRSCGGAAAAAPFDPSNVDAALTQFLTCGFAVIAPGLLPALTPQRLQQMAAFALAIVDGRDAPATSNATTVWKPADALIEAHAEGRGDMWPPFSADFPFGARLMAELTSLGPLLRGVFGEDPAFDFLSLLYVRQGAPAQGWHSDSAWPGPGEGAEAGCLRGGALKVQVLLHDLRPERGMVHFLAHGAPSNSFEHEYYDNFEGAVPRSHRITPATLRAGSVILYNPTTSHAGGANRLSLDKAVLDVSFKADQAYESGDDTEQRFEAGVRKYRSGEAGGESVESYREAWLGAWRDANGADRPPAARPAWAAALPAGNARACRTEAVLRARLDQLRNGSATCEAAAAPGDWPLPGVLLTGSMAEIAAHRALRAGGGAEGGAEGGAGRAAPASDGSDAGAAVAGYNRLMLLLRNGARAGGALSAAELRPLLDATRRLPAVHARFLVEAADMMHYLVWRNEAEVLALLAGFGVEIDRSLFPLREDAQLEMTLLELASCLGRKAVRRALLSAGAVDDADCSKQQLAQAKSMAQEEAKRVKEATAAGAGSEVVADGDDDGGEDDEDFDRRDVDGE